MKQTTYFLLVCLVIIVFGAKMVEAQREDPNMKPEVSAPGEDIISTNDPSLSIPYASSSGTSVSTVFVVGTLALIMEKHELELTEYKETNGSELYLDLIKYSLQESMMEEMHDSRSGYGLLDAVSWERNIANSLP